MFWFPIPELINSIVSEVSVFASVRMSTGMDRHAFRNIEGELFLRGKL
jgi:hypothetical protein